MACAVAFQAGRVLGQQPDAESQPGTRFSVDELKQQMFQLSAGRRLKPASWRAGARIAVALSFDVEGRISGLKQRHGLARCRYRGMRGMERWVGLGVIANNLLVLARAPAPMSRKARERGAQEQA